MDANRFSTESLRDPRLLHILAAAIQAVEPGAAIERYLKSHPLKRNGRIYGLAIGKAALPMLEALARSVPLTKGLAVTKHASSPTLRGLTVMEGGHPLPDERSLLAGRRVVEWVGMLQENDTLICLISGGGSALVSAPWPGLSLHDLRALTALLLSCGARIDEINILRRHLDQIKGGGLLRLTPAKHVLSLILSDVIGNPLEAIASGPTAPDPSRREDALAVLEKYRLMAQIPAAILAALRHAPETLKPGDPRLETVQNVIVGDNALAIRAALKQAEKEGFASESLGSAWQGEARQVGEQFAACFLAALARRPRPFCLVAGGETTVTLRGSGRGGRNQELALASVPVLAGQRDIRLIALASDGEDGPTDAAGAVVSGETYQRGKMLGLEVAHHLSENDSYTFFAALGDLLHPGPTGTNVNDLIFLIAW
ncbi:MAG: glycerate kinase type-2 family protein [Anaerolineae bacterium]